MHAVPATANAASGRYAIFGEIASGGMATIQYGRAVAAGGFSRAVAIKRLHPQFAKDPAFVSMFLDEARLASRIAHANVVPTLDVLSGPDELAVVMEYVHGESLSRLMRAASERGECIPQRIAVTLLAGVLHGLHAAHETYDDHGEPLHIVHRDVSPENVLVGSDGVPRLIDFGIARARGRSRLTPAGELKGKLAYMALEQYQGVVVDRRADVYGAAVVLWEALTGRDLFSGDSDAAVVNAVMQQEVAPPSTLRAELPAALDQIVMRGLSRDREARFATAREMALALERQVGVTTQSEVADWLEEEAGDLLAQRATMLRQQRAPRAFLAVDDELGGTRVVSAPPEPSGSESEPAAPSVPTEPQPPPRRRSGLRTVQPRRGMVIAAMVVLTLALAGAALYVARTPAPAPAPDATTEAPHAEPAPPTAIEPVPADEPAAPTPAPAPAIVEPAHASPPPEPAPTRDTPAVPPRAKRSPRAQPSERKSKTIDCANPFVVDERGIRRARPECL
ncbi:MAG: protein kinase [Polyangiales bacterium]